MKNAKRLICTRNLFGILAVATVWCEEADDSDECNENTRHDKCCDVVGRITFKHYVVRNVRELIRTTVVTFVVETRCEVSQYPFFVRDVVR